jgi:fructan beta-fructosidase
MKRLTILLFFFVPFMCAFSQGKKVVKPFDEVYRPQYHFMPEFNKMGNPISVWTKDSVYHLFFQYNPHNLLPGYINWGHASSKDLLHWEHKGLTLKQPEPVRDSMYQVPWWGSVCTVNNGVMALVNRWDDGIYQIFSPDGMTWKEAVKTSGTEGLEKSEAHVFWYEPTRKWVMVAFDRITTTMFIYNSDDGLAWEKTSSFNYTFGYPQLFELPVDRRPDDTRWVLATEKGTYLLGSFDGKEMKLETSVKQFNHGRKTVATIFFPDIKQERMLGMSFLQGEQLADLPASGQLSLPFEFRLHKSEKGIELIQQPLEELEQLHQKSYVWENKKIYPGIKNNLLKGIRGNELRIKATIDLLSSDQFGFLIRSNREQAGTEISYNVKKAFINFLGTQLDYVPQNKKIELEILIDRSSIELLIDGGRHVISYPFTPSPEAPFYELFTTGGEINVDKMEVVTLKSIWQED